MNLKSYFFMWEILMDKDKLREWMRLFKKEEPMEQKLFKLVGLIGVVASIVNGFIYMVLPEHITTALICFGAGACTMALIIYVQVSGKYLFAYLVSVFGVFTGLFIVLFFYQGANSGYLFIMGLVFTCMLLHGKALAIAAPIQALCYLAAFVYTYYHPELIHDKSSPEKNLLSLILGCLGCGLIICASLRVYITQYQKANAAAAAAAEEAQEANKAKDRFLANMSHEIRTPVTTILGMNEMIAREEASATVKDWTEDIDLSGKELLDLIDNILDYSRMGAGKEILRESVYPTSALIHKWQFTGENLSSKKGLAFKMNVDSAVPAYLYGDEAKINRIVLNLISNAVKYTDFGIIRLNVAVAPLADDKVGVSITVKDTGHGIRKEDLSTIFESFERLDANRNRGIKGTGLGLAISRELAELMGGTLTCKSEYEKGSEFTLSITQALRRESDYSTDETNIALFNKMFIAPNARVLVVDDSPNNRKIVSLLLRRTKIKLDMAESGIEALSRYKANRYDAVLMDYRMSEMDGIETMERIRFFDNDENIHTPVIVMTADIVGNVREKLLGAGFDAFVAKPFTEMTITSVLYKLLPEDLVTVIDCESSAVPVPEDEEETLTAVSSESRLLMMVDDEPPMHKLAGTILREAGYDVINAESGEKALTLLKDIVQTGSQLPSLILLDINMQGADGYEVFSQIRTVPGCEYIPIIFMTSETSVDTEVKCMELGAADFITKPFVKDIMLARISNHIAVWENLRTELAAPNDSERFDAKKLETMEQKLSATELLIAKMMSEGYTNREIAEKTNYSYAYIKKKSTTIFGKLGVNKRTQIRDLLK